MQQQDIPNSSDRDLAQGIAAYIDHTLLRPTTTDAEVRQLCEEARAYGFKAVCIPGAFLPTATQALSGSSTQLAAVVGFPLGHAATRAKSCEASACLEAGAQELDVVLNIGWMQSAQHSRIAAELTELRREVPQACLKLILETCYLSDAQKRTACKLALDAGWDFVKTSTGFGTAGASIPDVRLMKEAVSGRLGVKASGGIRDLTKALEYLRAGATRIGTSSGVAIAKAARGLK